MVLNTECDDLMKPALLLFFASVYEFNTSYLESFFRVLREDWIDLKRVSGKNYQIRINAENDRENPAVILVVVLQDRIVYFCKKASNRSK